MRRSHFWAALGFVLATLFACVAPVPATAVVGQLHVRFRPVTQGAVRYAWAGDGYLFAQAAASSDQFARAGELIEERTGRSRSVPIAGGPCTPMGIGGGRLLFSCGTLLSSDSTTGRAVVKLYSLTRGTWQTEIGPSLPCDVNDDRCVIDAVRIGTDWIEYDNTSCTVHCSDPPDQYVYQSLHTGKVRRDPIGGSTIANVNSPNLAERACSRLRVPTVRDAYNNDFGAQSLPGSLTLLGRFGLAAGGGNQFSLHQCGSKKSIRIDTQQHPAVEPPTFVGRPGWCLAPFCGPAANDKAVVWDVSPTRLYGRLLPSLKPFAINVPGEAGGLAEVLLTPAYLYVLDRSGHLWRTPSPSAEPPR